ncbi:MAG TPA: hypothetical protein VGD01_17510 [Candidatus Elarobacter sp.]
MLVAAALVLALPGPAAAQTVQPLRTLTYSVAYSVRSTMTARNSGLGGIGQVGEHSAARPPGFQDYGFSGDDSGTVRVDIIAATADLGLVVDASYDGKAKQLPIRVAIFRDGRLTHDPRLTLAPQVVELLPLLARGLLAEYGYDPGAVWSVPVPEPATGTRAFRVVAATDTLSTVALSADLGVKGPQGFEEHQDGTFSYDRTLSTPVKFDTRILLRRANGSEVSEIHLTAALATDTFAKKP